jgi:hypothetical protein
MKDEDIFDILDGIASEETIRQHTILLSESAEYQTLFKEYAHTHALLTDTSMEKTAFNFTDKLIDRWEISQEVVMVRKSYKLPVYFLGAMTLVAIILIFITLPSMNQANIPFDVNRYTDILQNKLLTRFFLIINVLVALFFIDRKILKPYFGKRFGV